MRKERRSQNIKDDMEVVGVNELSDDAVEAITGGAVWKYKGRWYCGEEDGTLYRSSAKDGYKRKSGARFSAFWTAGYERSTMFKEIDCPWKNDVDARKGGAKV